MTGHTKPSVLLRKAKVGLYEAVGKDVPTDSRAGYTDTFELLSPLVRIAYKKRPKGTTYPTKGAKDAALAAANLAMKIMRQANDELAAVVMLRRKESALFTAIMDKHFGLIEGDTSGGFLKDNVKDKKFSLKAIAQKDRRWVLEKIRRDMLHLSFHLNTGIYLIDADAAGRDIRSGQTHNPANSNANEEAYVSAAKTKFDKVSWQPTEYRWDANKITCGFRHGEIHVGLSLLEAYSAISYARVIIHEATHKYLNTNDEAYAHEATYPTLALSKTLINADSFAWAAVSFYCGEVRMGDPTDYNPDWAQSAKA